MSLQSCSEMTMCNTCLCFLNMLTSANLIDCYIVTSAETSKWFCDNAILAEISALLLLCEITNFNHLFNQILICPGGVMNFNWDKKIVI